MVGCVVVRDSDDPVVSVWKQIVETRAYALRVGVALAGMALVGAILPLFMTCPTVPFAVIFGLLSSQAFTAYTLLGKIAGLQAALDMKRIALDYESTSRRELYALQAGDTISVVGVPNGVDVKLQALTACRLERVS